MSPRKKAGELRALPSGRGHALVLVTSRRSGAGKTTLIERLVPALRKRGLTVGAIKLSHHDVETDTPGKDTRRIRDAGAAAVILVGPTRLTAFAPSRAVAGLQLWHAYGALLYLGEFPDVVLVEGGRGIRGVRRIEVCATGSTATGGAAGLVAVASDDLAAAGRERHRGAPVFRRDDAEGLAGRIAELVERTADDPRGATSRRGAAGARPPQDPSRRRRAAKPARSSKRASSGARRGPRR